MRLERTFFYFYEVLSRHKNGILQLLQLKTEMVYSCGTVRYSFCVHMHYPSECDTDAKYYQKW